MKRLNYLPVFFVATAISMGNVLVQTGALKTMTLIMFDWMRPLMVASVFALAVVPYWTAFSYHIFSATRLACWPLPCPAS